MNSPTISKSMKTLYNSINENATNIMKKEYSGSIINITNNIENNRNDLDFVISIHSNCYINEIRARIHKILSSDIKQLPNGHQEMLYI